MPRYDEFPLIKQPPSPSVLACVQPELRPISPSRVADGLSTAVEAAQFALPCCSLLEYQKNVARACLISSLKPTLDQVLQLHIVLYKKVIRICTLIDTWVLERFFVSGILSKEAKDHTKPEYCLLPTLLDYLGSFGLKDLQFTRMAHASPTDHVMLCIALDGEESVECSPPPSSRLHFTMVVWCFRRWPPTARHNRTITGKKTEEAANVGLPDSPLKKSEAESQ